MATTTDPTNLFHTLQGGLDRRQKELELQLQILKQNHKLWRVLEAEYEGLKEELLLLDESCDTEDILAVIDDYGSKVISPQDAKRLLGLSGREERSRNEVLAVLMQHLKGIQKQAAAAEKEGGLVVEKLEKVMTVAKPTLVDEEGRLLMEIREELDEEGNVISSSVMTPSHNVDKIEAILDKTERLEEAERKMREEEEAKKKTTDSASESGDRASVEKLNQTSPSPAPDSAQETKETVKKEIHEGKTAKTRLEDKKDENRQDKAEVSREGKAKEENETRKTVEERNEKDEKDTQTPSPASALVSAPLPSIEEVHNNSTSGPSIAELQQQDATIPSAPVYPDETKAEREMREQMIRYSLGEIGPVVAQLDLEEGLVSDNDGEWDVVLEGEEDSENEPAIQGDDDDDEEEEDLYTDDIDESIFDSLYTGDTDDEDRDELKAHTHITAEYRQQMAELEARLNAKLLGNAGPNPDLDKLRAAGEAGEIDLSLTPEVNTEDRDSEVVEEEGSKKAAMATATTTESNRASILSADKRSEPVAETTTTTAATTTGAAPASNKPKSQKKSVKFAADLDIAPHTTLSQPSESPATATAPSKPATKPAAPIANPVGEHILERKAPVSKGLKTPQPPLAPGKPKKQSVFGARRSAMAGSPTTVSEPASTSASPSASAPKSAPTSASEPASEISEQSPKPTISNSIHERLVPKPAKFSSSSSSSPSSTTTTTKPSKPLPPSFPDTLDPGLLRREVVTEYYRHRNRIIQAEGGFTRPEEEEEEGPLMEVDEHGNTRRVSRFKAARIRGGGLM